AADWCRACGETLPRRGRNWESQESSMKRHLFWAAIAGTLLAGTAAYGHHSLAATYLDKEVKLEGKVLDLLLRNPHSFLQIEAPDEKGVMQRWSLEWRSSGQLGQQGIKRDTLKVGDEVEVTINPSRTA